MRKYPRLRVRQPARNGGNLPEPPPGARQWFQSEESQFPCPIPGFEDYWGCVNKITGGVGGDYLRQNQPSVAPPGGDIAGKICFDLPLGTLGWIRYLAGPVQSISNGLTVGFVLRVDDPPSFFRLLFTSSDDSFYGTGYGIVVPDASGPTVHVFVGTAGWDGSTYAAGIPWNPTPGEVYRCVIVYDRNTGVVTFRANGVQIGTYNYTYNPVNETGNTFYMGAGGSPGNIGHHVQTYIDYGETLDSAQIADLELYLDARAGV